MRRLTCLTLFLLHAAVCAFAQDPSPQPDPAAEPAFAAGPLTFSGLIDGYYSLNFNHPASKANTIRNFDTKANQFSLNFARLAIEHEADPVGFRLELAGGPAMDIFHSTDPAG